MDKYDMKEKLVDILVDPIDLKCLEIKDSEYDGDEVVSGFLCSLNGRKYEIKSGIPRFVNFSDPDQEQTSDSFAYKWKRDGIKESRGCVDSAFKWYVEKYGFKSPENFVSYFSGRNRILDLGCGSGFSSMQFLNTTKWRGNVMWIGIDISNAIDVAFERLNKFANTHFVQADALRLPFEDETFDTVFSEGVMHHTPETKKALFSGTRVLRKGGEILFYVYRRKGPVREFTDDYIRKQISTLSNEEAFDVMKSLALLGKALTDLQAEVEVKEDVPILGIKKGKHDIQRLIYWNFAKLFWNEDFGFEENVLTNFDWYRPKYAHRHTAEELKKWCSEANLDINWFHEQESGFSVRAVKCV